MFHVLRMIYLRHLNSKFSSLKIAVTGLEVSMVLACVIYTPAKMPNIVPWMKGD
jgi:hypothetical protein